MSNDPDLFSSKKSKSSPQSSLVTSISSASGRHLLHSSRSTSPLLSVSHLMRWSLTLDQFLVTSTRSFSIAECRSSARGGGGGGGGASADLSAFAFTFFF